MNLSHLKYFYDAARLGSISKAATLNYIGQPALSKAIKALEIELNTNLVVHKRNSFELTEQGVRVLKNSQKIFDSVETLKDSLYDEEEVSGEVHFSCQSSMGESHLLTNSIKIMRSYFPKLNPVLSLGRTDLVRTWLQDGKIDFALVINNRDFSDFNTQIISKGYFHLIKSKDYKKNWKSEGVLITEPTKEVEDLKIRYYQFQQNHLPVMMQIGSWSVIKNFVLEGIGVGYVPDYLIEKEIKNRKVKYIEKSKYSTPYEVLLITPKNKYISSKVKRVIDKIFCG